MIILEHMMLRTLILKAGYLDVDKTQHEAQVHRPYLQMQDKWSSKYLIQLKRSDFKVLNTA